ncbi:hypothetical protein PG997_004018 [Apiospora hydei]|uniref:Uncharacterized protein n=1 Tax=Apiospora hydei TaxID=1337664 RepID=A0ABR1X116_9PEZI
MELLPPEIILGMVEQHMNMATVMQFMQTTKARFPALPGVAWRGEPRWQHAVCRPRAMCYPRAAPSVASLPPTPSAQSWSWTSGKSASATPCGATFWEHGQSPLLGPLTRRQQARLLELMRASLCHCDHIADIAAACSDPRTPAQTRTAQIDYVASLSTEQLAALFYTVDMAGFGFVRARKYEAEDPLVWEKITVFEECLLRHGSWFLWAHLQGGQANHAAQLIEAGLKELTDWETGKEGMLPGLRMSLVDAYRARLEDAHDVDLEASLRERVRRLVMAPQNT